MLSRAPASLETSKGLSIKPAVAQQQTRPAFKPTNATPTTPDSEGSVYSNEPEYNNEPGNSSELAYPTGHKTHFQPYFKDLCGHKSHICSTGYAGQSAQARTGALLSSDFAGNAGEHCAAVFDPKAKALTASADIPKIKPRFFHGESAVAVGIGAVTVSSSAGGQKQGHYSMTHSASMAR